MLKQRLLAVEHEKFALRQQLAKMAAALQRVGASSRSVSLGPGHSAPPSPTLTAELLQHDRAIKQELEEFSFSMPSPQNTLDPRSSFSSVASSRAHTPIPVEFNGAVSSPDMTQHPAAMLCGLQCQSGAVSRPLSNPGSPPDKALPPSRASPPPHRPTLAPPPLTRLHLFLAVHSAVCSTLLQPLSQLLTSLKTGSPLTAPRMSPMLFHSIRWWISTPTNPLKSTLATRVASLPLTTTISATTKTNTTSRPPLPATVFRISLLRCLLACSPALARPLEDATGPALQMKARYALRGESKAGGCWVEEHGAYRRFGRGEDIHRWSSEVRLLLRATRVVLDQHRNAKLRRGVSRVDRKRNRRA